MTSISQETDASMKELLEKLVTSLCSNLPVSEVTIRRHVWRDADYVGLANGKVAVWQGWSVNLQACHSDLKNVYIDYVDNVLTERDRAELFGDLFSAQIASMEAFVYCFATRFPLGAESQLQKEGFTVRRLLRRLHAGILCNSKDFNEVSVRDWIPQLEKLLAIQAELRK